MSHTLTIAGPKGGTGKSITAVNLAASFSLFEKKTLLIDCDPMGCSTLYCGINHQDYTSDMASVLSAKARFTDAIIKTELNYLDMMPAGFDLYPATVKLSRNPGNEKVLRLFLKDVASVYDYIVIDSPSSHTFLSTLAMTAADWLVVSMTPELNSIKDFESLLKIVKYIRTIHDVPVKIAKVLFNRTCSREEINAFLEKQALTEISALVCQSFIPEDSVIEKSILRNSPAALLDLNSPASDAFLSAAQELHFFFHPRGVQ